MKAQLEARLLKIWYGADKPTPFESLALTCLEGVYKTIRVLGRHDSKSARCRTRTNPPLLVVGNVIAGGAGKTPIVMAVCQFMHTQGKR